MNWKEVATIIVLHIEMSGNLLEHIKQLNKLQGGGIIGQKFIKLTTFLWQEE